MEKAIESDIRIGKVVPRDVDENVIDEVVIDEVPVADVQVQVSESTVVDGDIVVPVVGVKDDQVQGGI